MSHTSKDDPNSEAAGSSVDIPEQIVAQAEAAAAGSGEQSINTDTATVQETRRS